MHKLLKACMHDSLYKGCQNISFVIQFDATFAMDNVNYATQEVNANGPNANNDDTSRHWYETLDHRHTTRAALTPEVPQKQKPTCTINLLALSLVMQCVMSIALVAILTMEGYSFYTIQHGCTPNINEWMDDVKQSLLMTMSCNVSNHTYNNDPICRQLIGTTKESAQKLTNTVDMLSNLSNVSKSIASTVDDIHQVLSQNGTYGSLSKSCKEVKMKQPNSLSGYYNIDGNNLYCSMGMLCGLGGGWTRLAFLNMSDNTNSCPFGFKLYQSGGVRACGRPASSGGSCVSALFPSNGISYSQVCGRVVGYQFGTVNAVRRGINNKNTFYVDGVSITIGSSRYHIWTFMAGASGVSMLTAAGNCPCSNSSTQQVPSFIQNHYFCESGRNSNAQRIFHLQASNPLWDGQGCGPLESDCCTVPGIPWFYRIGDAATTDYLELRVCGDEGTDNEDVPVEYYEIYVK